MPFVFLLKFISLIDQSTPLMIGQLTYVSDDISARRTNFKMSSKRASRIRRHCTLVSPRRLESVSH